jgi:O-antigen/teichoic acid export membrane protein
MTVLSRTIRQNVFNSLLDYVSQPALMLIGAPLLLRALGVQQYDTWMLVNSVAATASGLGGGFGDGATKYVYKYRGCRDSTGALRSTMAVLALNCGFGLLAAIVMAAAQYHDLLVAMAIGNGLLALSVVPQYAALAFGRSRALAMVSLASGVLSLGCGYFLIHRMALLGAGFAKIIAGVIFLSVFGIVRRSLEDDEPKGHTFDAATATGLDFAQ